MADGTKLGASKFLERFAFTSEQQYTYLSKLSGGEKRRLQLLSILFKNPNFLVLDEPTNDLDLQTLQILEEFLLEYQGCILLVSHDRYFMDKLVDHLFVFEGDGVISDFPGNYSQFRIKEVERDNAPSTAGGKQAMIGTTVLTGSNQVAIEEDIVKPKAAVQKLSYNEKREFETLEKDMPLLEKEKQDLEINMSKEGINFDQIQLAAKRVADIIALLEEKELRWLELSERL
jgi:ATP-binding cassette subfamily F protein uup